MELHLKGSVSEDGQLNVALPGKAPRGAVEVILRTRETDDVAASNRELFAWLDGLHADPSRTTRTREQIDAGLQVERNAWG